jgi:hypothetical protein
MGAAAGAHMLVQYDRSGRAVVTMRGTDIMARMRATTLSRISATTAMVLLTLALLSGCAKEPEPPPTLPFVGDWESVANQAALQLSLYEDGTGAVYAWTIFHPDERIPMEVVGWSVDPEDGAISVKVISPGVTEPREMGGTYEWLGEKLMIHHVSPEGSAETRTYKRVDVTETSAGGG